MAGGLAAGSIGKTGEVWSDIRGTGGCVGGLGIDGWGGAMGGNATTLVLIVLMTGAVPFIIGLEPLNVGRAKPGGACRGNKM